MVVGVCDCVSTCSHSRDKTHQCLPIPVYSSSQEHACLCKISRVHITYAQLYTHAWNFTLQDTVESHSLAMSSPPQYNNEVHWVDLTMVERTSLQGHAAFQPLCRRLSESEHCFLNNAFPLHSKGHVCVYIPQLFLEQSRMLCG